MRPRTRQHGLIQGVRRARATKVLALLVVAAASVAQIAASWHETVVQHVRCSEHGELAHAIAAHEHGRSAGPGAELDTEPGPLTSSDEHCGVALTVQGNAQTQVARTAVRFTPPPAAVRVRAVAALQPPGRAFVLASAPKTSPPTA